MILSLRDDLSLFMLNIYFTKFQSLLRYGIMLWGAEKESVKVLKTQRRVLRSIKQSLVDQSAKS
jgi:hypothetical protein